LQSSGSPVALAKTDALPGMNQTKLPALLQSMKPDFWRLGMTTLALETEPIATNVKMRHGQRFILIL